MWELFRTKQPQISSQNCKSKKLIAHSPFGRKIIDRQHLSLDAAVYPAPLF
jgi:hypothetical protein